MYNRLLKVLILLILGVLSFPVRGAGPLIIAHRGASGYLPEHTLEAYILAIDMGADFIEPDLVLTRDGVLVVRHDHYLSTTTNISDLKQFADRRRTLGDRTDWFSEDLTTAEFKQLRARQAFRGRSREHDDQFSIPTFQDVIDLVRRKAAEKGRVIGLYPELKIPQYFKQLGFNPVGILVGLLERNKMTVSGIPLFIQSFDPDTLRLLNSTTAFSLIQLVEPATDRDATGRLKPSVSLNELAAYADGLGVSKRLVMGPDGLSTGLVESAHQRGLKVHIWTLRNDAYPRTVFDSPEEELRFFMSLGVDGLFTDFPDTALKIRNRLFGD